MSGTCDVMCSLHTHIIILTCSVFWFLGGKIYMLGRNQEKTEAAAKEVIEQSKADPDKVKVSVNLSRLPFSGHVHDG